MSSGKRVPLLDDDDMFMPAFDKALRSIFERFDADKDGYLNVDEVQAFAVATNGKKFDEDTMAEIALYFGDDDQKPTMMVSVTGFMDMYHLQSQNDEDETWKDLTRLGFDHELNPVPAKQE
ncbi:hypothetical protein H9P43_006173 [Blastocladiella emersonii ATCC 22665]|nr:hypothetical protein H9P43_006173 [Blastocladiella emersonii ATCC 22665]